jgi:outer membrane lipoprotein-sorting protein
MKKTLLLFLVLSIAFGASAQEFKKYGFKSCIAKKQSTTSGQVVEGTVYIDDYGAFECDIQTMDIPGFIKYDYGILTRGDRIWTFNIQEDGKVQSKESPNPMSDLNFLDVTDELAQKYEIQDLGEETYGGKDCHKYFYIVLTNRKKVEWTVWTYKGFPLKTVVKQGRKESVVEIVDFQENAKVPDNILHLIPE